MQKSVLRLLRFLLVAVGVGFFCPICATEGQSYFDLAMLSYDGTGGAEENPEAYPLFEKAARLGHAEAQYFTGRLIVNSPKLDNADAVVWFRKSANQGSAKGQYGLGYAYFFGEGVKADDERAADWFEKAASQNHPGALMRLSEIYREGIGRQKDELKSKALLESAAERDNAEAQFFLAVSVLKGKPSDEDLSIARFWLEASATQSFSPAQYRLGKLYEEGTGVQQDGAVALFWYKKSLESWRYSNADKAIARMYETGTAVPQDLVEAYFWYSRRSNSPEDIKRLKAKMDSRQLAEAFERVKNWKLSQPEYQYQHCETDADGEAVTFPENYALSDVVVSMQKLGCYGPCPKYLVEIYGDGAVILHDYGELPYQQVNAASFGDPDAIEELLSRFHEVEFFSRKPSYTSIPTISSIEYGIVRSGTIHSSGGMNTKIGLTIGACFKEVNLQYGVPDDLKELALLIEKTAGVERLSN